MGVRFNMRARSINIKSIVAVIAVLACVFIYNSFAGGSFSVPEGTISVHFVDVGQGDATIILSSDGEAMLIDAGTPDSRDELCSYISSLGIREFDYVVFTHPHSDHIGGGSRILERFGVGSIIMPNASHTSNLYENLLDDILEKDIPVTEANAGDHFYMGDAKFTVLAPNGDGYADLNNYSVVLKMEFGRRAFLFCGDAEIESESEMLSAFLAGELSADVIKLGHHGSSTSSSSRFLNAVDPSIAIASLGKNNEYGHPHREVLSALESRGITFYRTDIDKTVVLLCDGKDISFYDENGGAK